MKKPMGLIVVCAMLNTSGWAAEITKTEILDLDNPATVGGRYPYLVNAGDKALMSWLEPTIETDDEALNLMWSSFDGTGWSEPELINTSDGFFVNWADFPSLVAGREAPLAAHWPQKSEGGVYAYDVNVAFPSPGGKWEDPFIPHRDRSAREHGFVSMVPLDNDQVLALWLDGHQTKGMDHDSDHQDEGTTNLSTAMTLHAATLTSDGASLNEAEIDASVCDCCQTSVARTGDNIIAVYRNRDENEIRDHHRAVFDLQTQTWSEPVALSDDGWKISGCPVNGPQIDAFGETVIATWFSAANEKPRVAMAVSTDAGETFAAPKVLAGGSTFGRVDIAFNQSGTALLTWIQAEEEETVIKGQFWTQGRLSDVFTIGPIHQTRASGFPRSAAFGNDFLVGWTDPESGFRVKTKTISIPHD